MWYLIPNYSMKCRLYLNKAQKEKVDTILGALKFAYNVSMYEMVTNFVGAKETVDKQNEGQTIHYPNFGYFMKKEWLDQLRAKNPALNDVPSGAISSSVYGIFSDAKKAWESDTIITYRVDGKKVKHKLKGKLPLEKYKPSYYCIKHPRTSYSYQETGSKFTVSETNENTIYANLNKLGIVKIKGWNKKIRFDEKHEVDFVGLMKANRAKRYGITISKDNCGDYYIVFKLSNVYKYVDEPKEKIEIGVDVGIKDLAITSDGEKYENKHFAKNVKRKKKLIDRQVSRRYGWSNIKFREAHKFDATAMSSKGYEQSRLTQNKLARKIARQRENWNHQVSIDIVRKSQFIGIEDLNVNGMMSNRHMAYAASDVAMSDFLTKLSYKSMWYAVPIVKIGRFEPSSQLCHVCGYRNTETKNLAVREWACPQCGTHHDRDINASINILNMAKGKLDTNLLELDN